MKKLLYLLFIFLLSCSGGGGSEPVQETIAPTVEQVQVEPVPIALPSESLTIEEFAGKTMYLVEDDIGWSKAVFYENFDLEAYDPNQVEWYEKGRWSVTRGLLMCFPDGSDDGTVYELIDDDKVNRVYTMERTTSDGTIDTVWIYYDQETAFQQVQ